MAQPPAYFSCTSDDNCIVVPIRKRNTCVDSTASCKVLATWVSPILLLERTKARQLFLSTLCLLRHAPWNFDGLSVHHLHCRGITSLLSLLKTTVAVLFAHTQSLCCFVPGRHTTFIATTTHNLCRHPTDRRSSPCLWVSVRRRLRLFLERSNALDVVFCQCCNFI